MIKKTTSMAIKHFGEKHQIIKACEELSELQTILLQDLTKNDEIDVILIAEEIADVEIMIEQLKEIYGFNMIGNVVSRIKRKKIKRLRKIINEKEN